MSDNFDKGILLTILSLAIIPSVFFGITLTTKNDWWSFLGVVVDFAAFFLLFPNSGYNEGGT